MFDTLVLRHRALSLFRSTSWRFVPSRTPQRRRYHSKDHLSPPATAVPRVTKIEKIVLDAIKATGPLPFATYMQLCLSHPTYGYYMDPSNHVFGPRGDFTTSPEISQVFGELVAVWLASQWMSAKKPPSIRLIELGPGRGTLMADVLRVVSHVVKSEGVLKSVHLVETSPAMRALQKESLHKSFEKADFEIHWHDSINDIPPSNDFSMVIAHEFFDALPIHVLQKTEDGWQEVLIASNLEPTTSSGENTVGAVVQSSTAAIYPRLRRVLSPAPTATSTVLGLSSPRFQSLPIGASVEVSPASFKIVRQIGELLSHNSSQGQGSKGGCGLIMDYGGAKAFGNSFRAFKDHKIVDIFHQPGESDLTANVDFAFLQEAIGDLATTHGPISQSVFLERMGLRLRADILMHKAKSDERRIAIRDAANRLVDLTGMGKEYQVMGITSVGSGTEREAPADVWPFLKIEDKTRSP